MTGDVSYAAASQAHCAARCRPPAIGTRVEKSVSEVRSRLCCQQIIVATISLTNSSASPHFLRSCGPVS